MNIRTAKLFITELAYVLAAFVISILFILYIPIGCLSYLFIYEGRWKYSLILSFASLLLTLIFSVKTVIYILLSVLFLIPVCFMTLLVHGIGHRPSAAEEVH